MSNCKLCDKPRRKNSRYCDECRELLRMRYRKEYDSSPHQRLKSAIRQKTRAALRKGVIAKERCVVCGNPNTQIHHITYHNDPLEVIWLCVRHHREYHAIKRQELAKIPINAPIPPTTQIDDILEKFIQQRRANQTRAMLED